MCGKGKGFSCFRPARAGDTMGHPPRPVSFDESKVLSAIPPFLVRESPEYPAPNRRDPEPPIPDGLRYDGLSPEEEAQRRQHQAWLDWYQRQPESFRRRARGSKARWVRFRLGLPLDDEPAAMGEGRP